MSDIYSNGNGRAGSNGVKPSFEQVDIKDFLGDKNNYNPKIARIAKITNNNPTVIAGMESLLNEELIFRSFERALDGLVNATSERNLQIVEAALQTTINEIRSYNANGSQYVNDKRTSLYLFTLQSLIINLDKWEFPNKKKNTFKPSLVQKLQDVKFHCGYLEITDEVIRSQCFTNAYQQPYNKDLRNFEFIDERRLDAFALRLKKFALTQNPSDLYELNSLSRSRVASRSAKTLEKIVKHIETKFNIQELDLKTYTKYSHAINDEIIKFIGTNDLAVIYNITDALTQHLEAKERFKNDGRML